MHNWTGKGLALYYGSIKTGVCLGNMLFTSLWTIVLQEWPFSPQTEALASHWVMEQYRKQLRQSLCQITAETEASFLFTGQEDFVSLFKHTVSHLVMYHIIFLV